MLAQTPLHKKKHSRQGLGRIVRLHEVQGAAGLEPVDLLGVERVVDLDVERRSSSRGLDLQGQGVPLRESVETLDGNPVQRGRGRRRTEAYSASGAVASDVIDRGSNRGFDLIDPSRRAHVLRHLHGGRTNIWGKIYRQSFPCCALLECGRPAAAEVEGVAL